MSAFSGTLRFATPLVSLLLCLGAAAYELPAAVKLAPSGALDVEGSVFRILSFGPGHVAAPAIPVSNASGNADATRSSVKIGEACLNVALTPLSPSAFRYVSTLNSSKPLETLALVFEGHLKLAGKSFSIDGVPFDPAAEPRKDALFWRKRVRSVEFALASGSSLKVSGEFELKIVKGSEDARDYMVRFYFAPARGELKSSALSLDFALSQSVRTPVDLSASANMGFADEVAGDGKGGWTDQGPKNDLSSLKPGALPVGGTSFKVLDPSANGGKAAIVLGREFPKSSAVPLRGGGSWLQLLHAFGWTTFGKKAAELEVDFKDGSSQRIELVAGRDAGNWWDPLKCANAIVAWSGENPSARIGLYFTQFKLRRDDPVRLRLLADEGQLWLIVAMNLANAELPVDGIRSELLISKGPQWIPLDSPREVVPASPLDFSGMLDVPAGKYGRVVLSDDGHFAFENALDKRVKFVGVNLCFGANFLERESADALAERLARCGYNAVRIHHHDNGLVKRDAATSLELDAAAVDKLDYLFAAMKKRGLYITTDIFVSRKLRAGDGVPEWVAKAGPNQMKSLLPISRAAMENWKSFARLWLTHRNPYTGMSWADDPALYSVSLVNENNLSQWWSGVPEIAARYRALFAEWMAKTHPKETASEPGPENRRFLEFLYGLQERCALEQLSFLKKELGLKALISDVNMQDKLPLAFLRSKLDLVDDHKYHDHPRFPVVPWKLPYSHKQRSSVSCLGDEVPLKLLAARLFGKPFCVTEYKFCNPNVFRAEGGPMIGSCAALQDWDALYQFAWGHSNVTVENDRPFGSLDFANDPLAQLSDRITMLLFRRGDVAPSKEAFANIVPTGFWSSDAPLDPSDEFKRLGLIARIGELVEGSPLPSGVSVLTRAQADGSAPLPSARIEGLRRDMETRGVVLSSTGQIRLDSKAGTLAIETPESLSLTSLAGAALSAGALSIDGAKVPTTLCASSLDGRPLVESSAIILLHLTNTADGGDKFDSEDMKLKLAQGALPHLLLRDAVDVKLRLEGSAPSEVLALKLDGSSYGAVPFSFEGGVLSFKADNARYEGGVMAYWIRR